MEEKGCDKDTQVKVNYVGLTEIQNGSSTMCVFNGQGGIYQVMVYHMAEPPRAVLMFSR